MRRSGGFTRRDLLGVAVGFVLAVVVFALVVALPSIVGRGRGAGLWRLRLWWKPEARRIRCRDHLRALGQGMAAYLDEQGGGQWYPGDSPQDKEHDHGEHDVHDGQGAVADGNVAGSGYSRGDPHDVVDDPGLPADFGRDPPGDECDDGQGPGGDDGPQDKARQPLPAEPQVQVDQPEEREQGPDPDHGLEGDPDDVDRWLVEAGAANGFTEALRRGDTNLDGTVNATDLNDLALNWQQTGRVWSQGDFDGNGSVNAADLNDLALGWQSSIGTVAGSAAVPEPTAALLLSLAGSSLCLVVRRNKCFDGDAFARFLVNRKPRGVQP